MVPFTMLKYRLWGPVYKDLYWSGLLIFGLFPVYAPVIKWITKLGQAGPSSSSSRGNSGQNIAGSSRNTELRPNGIKAD